MDGSLSSIDDDSPDHRCFLLWPTSVHQINHFYNQANGCRAAGYLNPFFQTTRKQNMPLLRRSIMMLTSWRRNAIPGDVAVLFSRKIKPTPDCRPLEVER